MTDASGMTLIVSKGLGEKRPYFKYTCKGCGGEGQNTYGEPYYTDMLEHRLCWTCNYWREFEERCSKTHTSMTIIEGHVYTPGSRTSGSFRGMAGRRFDIAYIEPSIYSGQCITTFDLRSGSTMPPHLQLKFSDTAKFLSGASREQVGEITCWDSSGSRKEPYPLLSALRAR